MKTTCYLLAIALLFTCWGCEDAGFEPAKPDSTAAALPQHSEGNFVLFVSNQSKTPNPVDITVSIDGRPAIDGEFDNTGRRTFQHNWIKHQFDLKPGTHILRVTSRKGEAHLEQTFEVVDKHWAVADYWTSDATSDSRPSGFTFLIQDQPIGFE